MLTYNELVRLRKELTNGEISIDLAKELYFDNYREGQRAWHTKDWKERRTKVIKDKCEICGSRETLTLQHLSHPKKYYEYERDVTTKYAQIHIDFNPIIEKFEFGEYIEKNYDYVPIPLCPSCESRKLNKRIKKIPQFLCTDCHLEFDEPIHKSLDQLITGFYEKVETIEMRDKCFVSKDKWGNHHNLSNIMYWLQRQKAKTKEVENIKKEAFLYYLDDNIKYLSFEDTITACKKCASNSDLHNMVLCPKCKEYYKGVQYPTCIQCLPEEKRKTALEYIELGKEMRSMHERFGID
ncbi:MAG TPA: hypothetical protein VKR58_01175 [Aquella sp.]|nr:hypothetical protein [Aquella sp.]